MSRARVLVELQAHAPDWERRFLVIRDGLKPRKRQHAEQNLIRVKGRLAQPAGPTSVDDTNATVAMRRKRLGMTLPR